MRLEIGMEIPEVTLDTVHQGEAFLRDHLGARLALFMWAPW